MRKQIEADPMAQAGNGRNGTESADLELRSVSVSSAEAMELTPEGRLQTCILPMGLNLPDGLPYDKWAELGPVFRQISTQVQFAIGDWLNYGERSYGQTYEVAVDLTGLAEQTLMNMKTIAKAVEFSRRRENVPFSHHAEVASVAGGDQEKLLRAAITGHNTMTGRVLVMPREKFRQLVKEHKRQQGLLPAKPAPKPAAAPVSAPVALPDPKDVPPFPDDGRVEVLPPAPPAVEDPEAHLNDDPFRDEDTGEVPAGYTYTLPEVVDALEAAYEPAGGPNIDLNAELDKAAAVIQTLQARVAELEEELQGVQALYPIRVSERTFQRLREITQAEGYGSEVVRWLADCIDNLFTCMEQESKEAAL